MNKAYLIHHVPGRLRLKFPNAKDNPKFLEEVRFSIYAEEGVRQVDINSSTGSIVIWYDAAAHPELTEELSRLERPNVAFALEILQRNGSTEPKSIEDFLKQLNQNIKRETGYAVDLKKLFPVTIAAYDLLFVKRSKPTPLWLALLMFAFSSYMELNVVDPHPQLDQVLENLRAEIAALRTEVQKIVPLREEQAGSSG